MNYLEFFHKEDLFLLHIHLLIHSFTYYWTPVFWFIIQNCIIYVVAQSIPALAIVG